MKLFLVISSFLILTLRSSAQDDEASVDLINDVEHAMRQVKVKYLNVSLVSLIATPERYDGEM